VLDAARVAEAARERKAELGTTEVPRAERAAQVEDRREVDVDTAAAQRAARRAACRERLCVGRYELAGCVGGASGNARTSPPSWSTKTMAPGGRGAVRSQRRTSTPPTPRGAGSPETTTSAAFCCGVKAAAAASGAASIPSVTARA
jgi:hypothetical protein